MTSNRPESDPAVGGGAPAWRAALACALAGAALFQFFGNATRGYIDTTSLFYWWGSQWANPRAETEHGWLILGISAWLFWRNRGMADRGLGIADRGLETAEPPDPSDAASQTPPPFSNPQSPLRDPQFLPPAAALLGGLALHALGFAAQQTRVSILAFLLFTWGVLRLAGGRRWGAAAVFPLAFLIFAIPINALDTIGFWLRVWVVHASAAIAHAAGIGVLQSGTQLTAPDGAYNYDVAAACSGIRSLTAVTALSLLAGYLNFSTVARRALVLGLCFPLVYVGNVARIVAIIVAAQLGGPAWGDRAHEIMGYGVFLIVLGGVLLGMSAIRRWWPEPAADPRLPSDLPAYVPSGGAAGWGIAGLVVALAGGTGLFLRHLANLPPRGEAGVVLAADGLNPVELPAFVGTDWIGRRTEVTAIERDILPPDTGFSRKQYVALQNPRHGVFLSVVLSGRDRTSIHRPELCLVGQGWTIADTARHRFAFPGRPDAGFAATLLRVRREVQTPRGRKVVPELVAYWFVGGEQVAATHWQRLTLDAWNRVAHARADRWAYVLMQTGAEDGEAAALGRLQAVLDATLPAFQKPSPAP